MYKLRYYLSCLLLFASIGFYTGCEKNQVVNQDLGTSDSSRIDDAKAAAADDSRDYTALLSSALEPTEEYDVRDADMSCEDANRFALRAVERLGYKVTSFDKATNERSGLIKAKQRASWGEDEPVSVEITCHDDGVHIAPRSEIPPCEQANKVMHTAVASSGFTITQFTPATLIKAGLVEGQNEKGESASVSITCYIERNRVEMDTSEDSPLLANVDFYKALSDFQLGFYTAFSKYVELDPSDTGGGNQIRVVVRPFTKTDAKVVFGMEVLDPQPVKVVVNNPTHRTYRLEPERVMLIASSGGRVKPLSLEGQTFPTPPLTTRSITPGSKVEGYLFYPSGTYSGARGSFADNRTNEREGFSVEFGSE